MRNLRDRPIRQKITFVIMLISGVVLLLAFAALFCFQAYTLRRHSAHELAVVGEITAHNCASAVMFKDEGAAAQILTGLKTMPQIVSARLQLMDQQRLAYFGQSRDELEIKAAQLESGFRIDGNRILLAQPVMLDGKREGTLYLLADLQAMTSQLLKLYGGIFALVLAASLLVAFLLSGQFLRFVTNPILRLAGTARTIANHHDYSVRADKVCGDEVGVLTDAFNQMLAQIQTQDTALQDAQRELQEQVDALHHEIAARQQAEQARERLTAILEATPDFVGRTDLNGKLLYLNRAARRMIGLSDDEKLSGRLASEFHPDWANRILSTEAIPGALQDGTWIGETALLTRDAREIHVSQVLIAHNHSNGGVDFLSTVMRDITERKEAEEALRLSQQRLLETSRFAGMAEVATGVLHNVGNVLNSVNVSAGLVAEKLRRSKVPKVAKAAALLTERNGDLAEFLTTDANGRKLPTYFAKLGAFLEEENADLVREVDQLGRNIEHIKEVVAMQQSYAKVSGVFENLAAGELVADAIAMNMEAFERHGITVEQRCEPVPLVCVDRHKVLQILINLIRNGKHALQDSGRTDKQLIISVTSEAEGTVRIIVTDNGIGISPENLTRVFGHGFTTRKNGHGFGLHSGANAAQEIGGSLTASSQGLGKGASFVLELPTARASSSIL